ncbi:MAG: hypothetical protein QGD96_05580 [Anaerolineae bacterium]|nr:hypothetical protein [Anaerolineae bacterium]
MELTQPSRLTFWRSVLLLSAILPYLAIWQLLGLASELDVVVLASKSWMGLLSLLGFGGLAALLTLTATCFRTRERILSFLEPPAQLRWLGYILLTVSLTGYTIVFASAFGRNLLGELGWVRTLVFWAFSLIGMFGLKLIKKNTPWLSSLLLVVLFQTSLNLLITQFSGITSYPFAMGWSETSRYYYPALFLSENIFGSRLPWPILHPSLHLLLTPPYLFDAPLWFHRFWQVLLRFSLMGLTAHILIWRLNVRERAFRWLFLIWMVLYFFQGPLYFHLAVPVILILWGYSRQDDRRTWIFLFLASVWSGLSRINWYPMPGILASVLFFLEVPFQGKNFWSYIRKPLLWVMTGFVIALVTQRVYITLSGIHDPGYFYTSLASNLLWYRLLPNASYSVGVLPAALVASFPMWIAIFLALRQRRVDFHSVRLGLTFAALSVLFVGGLIVSMKIGGGVDIHNLDAYLATLLIVSVYLVFRRYASENDNSLSPFKLPWGLAVLLIAVPAWFLIGANVALKTYDPARTESIVYQLQARVDAVNRQGGEILFITQRHLISMHMLEGVNMVPEYEREELMEMAMANNLDYLQVFRSDMESQRFTAIVVDPLSYRLLGKNYAFGEENNVWVRRVIKPILCNYQEDAIYPEDQIAVYTPQSGERHCPEK